MPKTLWCGFLLLGMSFAAMVFAAPLPPFSPIDVAGRITAANWVPEQQVKANPGLSGSAGHDRVFPTHYLIKLVEYNGVDTAKAWQMTRMVDWHAVDGYPKEVAPPFIIVQIEHDDHEFLKPGMEIRVTGYAVSGDEGGTWTSHDRIIILKH